ncbi:MAG: class I SAM-dependent methyltransferase [Acidobacteriota bacterium]
MHSQTVITMNFDVKKTWNACGAAFDRFTSAEDSFSENIEWPAVSDMIGSLEDQRAIDLGCGSGIYSLRFAERGADVTAFDLSEVMISLAREKAQERGLNIDFQVADISRPLAFDRDQFDLVFTATALHYIEDLESFFSEAARVLKPGGRLIASVLHPISTALFAQSDGESVQGHPVYFGSRVRRIETPWLEFGEVSGEGREITSFHHTVADYFNAIRSAGLNVIEMREPHPSKEFAARNAARYEEALRVPVYLIFKAAF